MDFTCDKVNFTWFYVQCFFSAWGNSNSHVNILFSYVTIFSYMWKTHLWKRPVHMWHHQTLAKKICFTWNKKPNARENVKSTCDEANFTWFYVPGFVFTCGKSQSHLKHVNIFILIWKKAKTSVKTSSSHVKNFCCVKIKCVKMLNSHVKKQISCVLFPHVKIPVHMWGEKKTSRI